MELDIKHIPDQNRFETTVDGFTGYVKYRIENNGLDVVHTIVPQAIEGQGIGAALVKESYNYARDKGLKCKATCPFAVVWLRRHPEYMEEK